MTTAPAPPPRKPPAPIPRRREDRKIPIPKRAQSLEVISEFDYCYDWFCAIVRESEKRHD